MPDSTSKTCRRCGMNKLATLEHFFPDHRLKSGLTGHCRACGARKAKEARERDPDKEKMLQRARSKRWRERHPEESRAESRKYNRLRYEADPAAEHRRTAAWRAANPTKIKCYSLRYQKENSARLAIKDARYRKANPEWASAHRQKRRARLKNVKGEYTAQELKELYQSQGGRCAYCGQDLNDVYHADHVIPISRSECGPTNDISNIACACRRCNLNKGNKLLSEWVVRWYEHL